MWKYHEFSTTQILREIKVEESGASKIIILTHFEPQNFDFYDFLHLVKSEIDQKSKFRVSKLTKKDFLEIQGSEKLISRKIRVTEKT